jgi:hypothetical protein
MKPTILTILALALVMGATGASAAEPSADKRGDDYNVCRFLADHLPKLVHIFSCDDPTPGTAPKPDAGTAGSDSGSADGSWSDGRDWRSPPVPQPGIGPNDKGDSTSDGSGG